MNFRSDNPILGLVGSFFAGTFLPQPFMPSNILQIVAILSNYCYMKRNDIFQAMTGIPKDIFKTACTHSDLLILLTIACLYRFGHYEVQMFTERHYRNDFE